MRLPRASFLRLEGPLAALLLFGLPAPAPGQAPVPVRVADIATGTVTFPDVPWIYTIRTFVTFGDVTYYAADDGIHGEELWRSDGTPEGTALVRDICPGACSSAPEWMVGTGERLFFVTDDGEHGRELWTSDGTHDGTRLVLDIEPGPVWSDPSGLAVLGDLVLFSAETSMHGREPWRSDGSAEGTFELGDLAATITWPSDFFVAGSFAFFSTDADGIGSKLWRTDGTVAGTRLVDETPPYGPTVGAPLGIHYTKWVVSGGRLYFEGDDGNGGDAWVSDGTPGGTMKLVDFPAQPGPDLGWPDLGWWTAALGKVFFSATDPILGRELWVTDGTPQGSGVVADINPSSGYSSPWQSVEAGDTLFFHAFHPDSGTELWATDGTEAGTRLVKDIRPGPDSSRSIDIISLGAQLNAIDDRVVFYADDGEHGIQLWASDGTESGTVVVFGTPDSDAGEQIAPIAQRVFPAPGGSLLWSFSYGDGRRTLVRSNGTRAGTFPIWQSPAAPSSYPFGFAVRADGTVFFRADDGETGRELWRSDGTPEGTSLVIDLKPGSAWSRPYEIGATGKGVFFLPTRTSAPGTYFSDGTESGTFLLTGVGLFGAMEICGVTYLGSSGGALWRSDGTPSGTSALSGSPSLVYDPRFNGLTRIGRDLYLPAVQGLWRFESATEAFQQLAADVVQPNGFSPLGTEVAFAASDALGRELWTYDTVSGETARRTDLMPEPESGLWSWVDGRQVFFPAYFDSVPASNGTVMASIGDRLYFVGETPGEGVELWSYTPGGGAQIVADLQPGSASSFPDQLTPLGSTLYFVATDGTAGRELWCTDGTLAGTTLVTDLAPGPTSSLPQELLAVGDQLLFSAHRPDVGRELFAAGRSGVVLLGDIAPGPLPSSPTDLTAGRHGRVYFAANDGSTGFELWAVDIDTGEIFVDGFESGDVSGWSATE